MNSIAVFSLLFAVYNASAFNLPEQGNYALQQRIIGGQEAVADQFRYQVAIGKPESRNVFSGALIKDRWVLTAASVMGFVHKIQVRLGMIHKDRVRNSFTFNINSSNFFPHGDFRGGTMSNIALIRLPRMVYPHWIESAILPPPGGHYLGTNGIVSGCGFTSAYGSTADALQQVTLKIISNANCSHLVALPIDDQHFCTLNRRKGICLYDSGAPMVTEIGRILIGIAAFHETCKGAYVNGFIRVDRYLGWIDNTITEHSS